MNDVRICAVVTGKTIGEFLGNLEKIQEVADFVELRVDYIDGFSVDDIDKIVETGLKPVSTKKYIFTCRKKEEGGYFTGAESVRKAILEKAIGTGFDFVDVELSAANFQFTISNFSHKGTNFFKVSQSLLNDSIYNNKNTAGNIRKTKIILSFHDFTKTPTLSELEEIKKQMKVYSPDIMKFAAFVRDDKDSKVLFQFLLNKQDDEEMIVVGMGDEGKIVRIFGPLLGSYLTYASTDRSQTAAGQIEIGELKKLYNELGVEGLKL